MAGSVQPGDVQRSVLADKKLDPEWIKSLFDRGMPTVYRGADLKYIGMPVGGICAGQLYLGGDGKLWHWDIFNEPIQFYNDDAHYRTPLVPGNEIEQGFALRIVSGATPEVRALDAKGFSEVSFNGQYPIGTVQYTDKDFPLTATLAAFSPFIPLNVEDSSLPATILRLTVNNISAARVEAELGAWLENLVYQKSGHLFPAMRRNRIIRADDGTLLECGFRAISGGNSTKDRPVIVFDDFERADWGQWKAEGNAFGDGPAAGNPRKEQKLTGYLGARLANSYVGKGDQGIGKLTSKPFTIERRFINFLIGGGNQMGPKGVANAGVNLLVGGQVVRAATGANSDTMKLASWEVSDLEGASGVLEIVANAPGGWGHIEVDQIEFSDTSPLLQGTPSEQHDAGTLVLGLLGATSKDQGSASIGGNLPEGCFAAPSSATEEERKISAGAQERFIGALVHPMTLEPGASQEITFVLAWHFSNLIFPMSFRPGDAANAKTPVRKGRHYGTRFASAADVFHYVAKNESSLTAQTRLWRETWYDSSLPYWFLDRTLLNVSTLATSTCYRFEDGRFYGWEGVGCCSGTSTSVWHYEQAMGRLFPDLDILLRKRVDFNPQIAFDSKTGIIGCRGEYDRSQSADGQAGIILRAYRDYLVSPSDPFLKEKWPQIKLAATWLMSLDSNKDGILDLPQANTLDNTWYGKVPWITSLALAAAAATEAMAAVVGDSVFAAICKTFADAGRANFVRTFWNGEYFEQIPDPSKLEHVGAYNGCEIDQVLGQGWACQVGLDRLIPRKETRGALAAIWRYSFTPDVGPFRKAHPQGRWYAMPGETGTLMCSWPRGEQMRVTKGVDYYFNECMNGFEHQVAGHMIWEGMLEEGFAVERAVHDRYHAARRNPWNEVECGDHYARSMASYGAFIAVCGFEYHGPRGHIGFAPRLTPEDFKAAFTAAEGWGTYFQKVSGQKMQASLALKWGRLRLRSLSLAVAAKPASATVRAGSNPLETTVSHTDGKCTLTFAEDLVLSASQTLTIILA